MFTEAPEFEVDKGVLDPCCRKQGSRHCFQARYVNEHLFIPVCSCIHISGCSVGSDPRRVYSTQRVSPVRSPPETVLVLESPDKTACVTGSINTGPACGLREAHPACAESEAQVMLPRVCFSPSAST